MDDQNKSNEQLIAELAEAKRRFEELQDTVQKAEEVLFESEEKSNKIFDEELQESEDKFLSITNQSIIGIAIIQDDIIIYINRALGNIIGYSPEFLPCFIYLMVLQYR